MKTVSIPTRPYPTGPSGDLVGLVRGSAPCPFRSANFQVDRLILPAMGRHRQELTGL